MELPAGSHTLPEQCDFPPGRGFCFLSGLNPGQDEARAAGTTLPQRERSLSSVEGAKEALPGDGEREKTEPAGKNHLKSLEKATPDYFNYLN